MSKYVIELNEDCEIIQQICVTEYEHLHIESCYSCNLEELTDEYINENFGELQEDAYQRGLNDAWAAARRVLKEWEPSGAIGGTYRQSECLDGITAQQAIDAFKEADSVVVEGDEVKVRATGSSYLVTNADSVLGYSGIDTEGRVFLQPRKDIVKTGRHFDSVDAYLKGERE